MPDSIPASSVGRLHVITDFHLQQTFDHETLAERAIAGGADTIQFRQKHGVVRNQLIAAERVQAVCAAAEVPLIVNDRLDVALGVDARGLHVGQDDYPVRIARRVLGPGPIVGASASTIEQAQEAEAGGATYIGFGPIYPTRSKANAGATQGLARLRACCEAVSCPVIAIGGITHRRVADVLHVGAHGVAVLSAIATAPNPHRATRRFCLAIEEAL
ncbi:MAG: thiamine phosphate synthase [Longimonas sp.]|uniref:thiamine phosphate synthase n=1 Tax=Longimonas sp. TaxID=2039626 RepID=UPI003976465C